MKDYIFIIGTSGIGKSTLAKGLFNYYNGALVEQNGVPEFGIPKNVDEGVYEEKICWECYVSQIKKFNELGIKNVIGTDFDDLRTADIPVVFKGYDYITLKLVCHNEQQLIDQMMHRGNGLIDYELQKKCSDKINARELLINEIELDVTNKTAEKVLDEAIEIIENTDTFIDYTYEKPSKDKFYSWVISNGLR